MVDYRITFADHDVARGWRRGGGAAGSPPADPAMAIVPRARTRQPERRHGVTEALLARIRSGTLAAGARMPTRAALMAEYDVSSITMQRAFDDLVELGVVESRGSQGTFVAGRLPHRRRYALLFGSAPRADGGWSRFYQALEREAARVGPALGVELLVRRGQVDGPRPDDQEAFERQVALRLVAGLIFAYNPASHGGGPLLEAEVPRIAVADPTPAGVGSIVFDGRSMTARLAEVLRAQRRTRVAILASSTYPMAALVGGLREHGIEVRPQWALAVDLEHPAQAVPLTRLLFAPWAGERPDALFVADDNLEEPAVAALLAEGVRVGDDLAVVAHANFPRERPVPGDPIVRIGYDAGDVLTAAIEALRAARGKARGARPVVIEARLEHGDRR